MTGPVPRILVKTACYSGAGALAGFVIGALLGVRLAPSDTALGMIAAAVGVVAGGALSTLAATRGLRSAR